MAQIFRFQTNSIARASLAVVAFFIGASLGIICVLYWSSPDTREHAANIQ